MRRTDGVRTIADIRNRCWEDPDTQCWHWRYGRNGSGTASLFLPALGRATTINVAICVIKTGAPLPRGVVWHSTCSTPGCCNAAHFVAGTKSTQMLSLGLKRSPLERARISRARRRLSDAAVADICAAHGVPLAEIAARHGISAQYACQIRSGSKRPLPAANAASVFAWRAAA